MFRTLLGIAAFFSILLTVMVPVCAQQTTTTNPTTFPNQNSQTTPLTLDDAIKLATMQASSFQQASLNERSAAEDVKQAKSAFMPQVSAPFSYLYTSPALSVPPGTPRAPSFIANNAINEYQAYINVSGDFDINGRLRATLEKNRSLLAAAHAGTEAAGLALLLAVIEAYYSLALASAQVSAAEQNLTASEEFERVTSLLVAGGEVPPVDLTRAGLQTATRRGELEIARAEGLVSAGALRILVGYDFARPIAASDLSLAVPVDGELQQFKVEDVNRRPELNQFEAQVRAAQQEARIARADRLPQLSYSILGGFDTDSLRPPSLNEHTGVSAAISLGVPIFDWGQSRSKERQARLRAEIAVNERTVSRRAFEQQFYTGQAQAASALSRIRLAGTALTQARENLNASIARYRAGEAQIIEVTDALTMLATQRQALYQALFDYQVALARLRQATGR